MPGWPDNLDESSFCSWFAMTPQHWNLSSSDRSIHIVSMKTTQCVVTFYLGLCAVTSAFSSRQRSERVQTVPAEGATRRGFVQSAVTAAVVLSQRPMPASARLEAVDKPQLLPTEAGLNVIQTEKFLTPGQVKRMDNLLSSLEKDTGFRVRVLCQSYPNTPGLAIRDYWDLGKEGQKDDKYVVLVVDQFGGKGNLLNFNVGDGVKFALPNIFWTRLSAKYGNTFFVKENGVDIAITNAIESIVSCLRSEDGFCTAPPDEGQSLKSLGFN